MKKIEDRKDHLIEYLEQKGRLSVSEIAEQFEISLPTARRLCAQLEKESRLMRTHGGVRFVPPIKTTYTFDAFDAEYYAEKELIAKHAAELVKDNQIIFLESGTTVKHFAVALAERIRSGQLSAISVFTTSLINLDILESVCNITVVGGLYRHERRDFCGFLCERLMRTLHFNACFVGADALDLNEGIMAMDIETARLDELLIERSEQSVILAHSEKFRKHSLISYCSVHDVSTIITDSNLAAHIQREYQAAGINLICVS
jgi:DeoR/GlpR family transcriptional regulator of sugar metabolism